MGINWGSSWLWGLCFCCCFGCLGNEPVRLLGWGSGCLWTSYRGSYWGSRSLCCILACMCFMLGTELVRRGLPPNCCSCRGSRGSTPPYRGSNCWGADPGLSTPLVNLGSGIGPRGGCRRKNEKFGKQSHYWMSAKQSTNIMSLFITSAVQSKHDI